MIRNLESLSTIVGQVHILPSRSASDPSQQMDLVALKGGRSRYFELF